MEYTAGTDAGRRLDRYLEQIGAVLNNKKRRASFALYAQGLLGESERKSVEPIVARSHPKPRKCAAAHQRVCHFLVDSAWSDPEVRRVAAQYAMSSILQNGAIDCWIIDDTGFLKQGCHSVGVQRQYTGSAGKKTNCQVAVSLSLATRTEHMPIDFELYLPECWTANPERREEARIPDDVCFKTKAELALDMLKRAVDHGWPAGVLLADADYGRSSDFRDGIHALGLDYAVAVDPQTKVWLVDRLGRRSGEPMSTRELAQTIAQKPRGFRRVTWREGTKERLSARFAFRKVVPYHNDGYDPAVRRRILFVAEWLDGETSPTKWYLVDVHRSLSHKQLVRLIKQRWRTERVYQDLKGELGLDHYEGRRFPGWHHHVSVALSCYAFIVAERARSFPPSRAWSQVDRPYAVAA
mgnify:CR=1 FL=1